MTGEREHGAYVYIRVSAPRDDLTLLSFEHVFVSALSERMAYQKGYTRLRDKLAAGHQHMNDYVIRTD